MLVVLARIEVHPHDVSIATRLAARVAGETRREAGCLHYAFGQDISEAGLLWLAERWQTREALAQHFETPHMTAFREGLGRLRVRRILASSYEVSEERVLVDRRTEPHAHR